MQRFNPQAIIKAVNNTAILGAIGRYIAQSSFKLPKEGLSALLRSVRLLAFYDDRIYDCLPLNCFGSISDLGNFTANELYDVFDLLKDRYKSVFDSDKDRCKWSDEYCNTRSLLFPDLN